MRARPPRHDSSQSPRENLQGLMGMGTLCLILAGPGPGAEPATTTDGG